MILYDVVIIGGGPAGLAAAVSAHEHGLKNILVLERDSRPGGILLQCIHNGFGLHYFGEELTGPEYAARFSTRIQEIGIECKVNTMVISLDRAPDGKNHAVTAVNSKDGLMTLLSKTIVIATGCRERTRGAINIPGTRPAGIFTAGAAQRFVNIDGYMPGRKAVILGSGDIGLIMARRMTLEGAEVKMVCEVMPYSSGLSRNITQCLENFNIPLKLSTTVVEIHGKDRITGVTVAEVDGKRRPVPGTEEYVECDTLLLSVGLIPENEVSKLAGVQIDDVTKGPAVDQNMQTSIPGVFACGNAVHVHDLVDYVTSEGMLVGKCAAGYISAPSGSERQSADMIPIQAGENVTYTIPQYITEAVPVEIMFRTKAVFQGAYVVVKSGSTVLVKKKTRILRPGEMQTVALPAGNISSINLPVTVSVEISERGEK